MAAELIMSDVLLCVSLNKFRGLVLSIPQCVLGGATSFLFACVLVAGIKVSSCC
jgi:xanthine/uracil permease